MKPLLRILLLLGLMATSGMPLFINNMPVFMVYFVYCLVCAAIFGWQLKQYLPFLLVVAFILFVHMLDSGWYYLPTMIAQLMIVGTAVITLNVLQTDFVQLFLRIMTVLAIISLVIYIPILIQPGLANVMISSFPIHFELEAEQYGYTQVLHNFLIFTFPPDFFTIPRNAGPFWEAGVFGGYLFVALIFNTIIKKSVFNKIGLLFLVGILSTFSTTAYLALFLFIGIYYAVKIGSPILRAVSIIVFAGLATYAYSEVEFLGSKISDEVKQIAYDAQVQGGNSRFASAYLDITELDDKVNYLFFGRGTHPENRVATLNKDVQRNNGTTDIIAVWGIPFFILYTILLLRSIRTVCQHFGEREFVALLFLIIIYTLGFSEPYFRFGFFYALLLLYIPYWKAMEQTEESPQLTVQ